MIWDTFWDDGRLAPLSPGARWMVGYALKRAAQERRGGKTTLTDRGLCAAARVDPRSGIPWIKECISAQVLEGSTPPDTGATLIAVSPIFFHDSVHLNAVQSSREGEKERRKKEEGTTSSSSKPSAPKVAAIPDPNVKRLIDNLHTALTGLLGGQKPVEFQGGRVAKHFQNVLAKESVETVERAIGLWASSRPFSKNVGGWIATASEWVAKAKGLTVMPNGTAAKKDERFGTLKASHDADRFNPKAWEFPR